MCENIPQAFLVLDSTEKVVFKNEIFNQLFPYANDDKNEENFKQQDIKIIQNFMELKNILTLEQIIKIQQKDRQNLQQKQDFNKDFQQQQLMEKIVQTNSDSDSQIIDESIKQQIQQQNNNNNQNIQGKKQAEFNFATKKLRKVSQNQTCIFINKDQNNQQDINNTQNQQSLDDIKNNTKIKQSKPNSSIGAVTYNDYCSNEDYVINQYNSHNNEPQYKEHYNYENIYKFLLSQKEIQNSQISQEISLRDEYQNFINFHKKIPEKQNTKNNDTKQNQEKQQNNEPSIFFVKYNSSNQNEDYRVAKINIFNCNLKEKNYVCFLIIDITQSYKIYMQNIQTVGKLDLLSSLIPQIEQINGRQVDIKLIISDQIGESYSDQSLLRKILIDILNLCVQITFEGHIIIEIFKNVNEICFTIQDTSISMNGYINWEPNSQGNSFFFSILNQNKTHQITQSDFQDYLVYNDFGNNTFRTNSAQGDISHSIPKINSYQSQRHIKNSKQSIVMSKKLDQNEQTGILNNQKINSELALIMDDINNNHNNRSSNFSKSLCDLNPTSNSQNQGSLKSLNEQVNINNNNKQVLPKSNSGNNINQALKKLQKYQLNKILELDIENDENIFTKYEEKFEKNNSILNINESMINKKGNSILKQNSQFNSNLVNNFVANTNSSLEGTKLESSNNNQQVQENIENNKIQTQSQNPEAQQIQEKIKNLHEQIQQQLQYNEQTAKSGQSKIEELSQEENEQKIEESNINFDVFGDILYEDSVNPNGEFTSFSKNHQIFAKNSNDNSNINTSYSKYKGFESTAITGNKMIFSKDIEIQEEEQEDMIQKENYGEKIKQIKNTINFDNQPLQQLQQTTDQENFQQKTQEQNVYENIKDSQIRLSNYLNQNDSSLSQEQIFDQNLINIKIEADQEIESQNQAV
ncbi:hypothetical protein PPERSA_09867 [Pseudocohnilembus persalinus]|uniref:Uncharacterized protein n=1 Tax=Pseudocohnilembus persalinus TaxID=266149 RepID=A0A0V0QTW1_PSEPJ|nr:hypothetical protein PPERSA_09867 [Pseudocohnilembus persalinus]|eukprot:KRX05727.1 hypothetical protein PPERSA_09867 [Pseudocohnilembus persalinus]